MRDGWLRLAISERRYQASTQLHHPNPSAMIVEAFLRRLQPRPLSMDCGPSRVRYAGLRPPLTASPTRRGPQKSTATGGLRLTVAAKW